MLKGLLRAILPRKADRGPVSSSRASDHRQPLILVFNSMWGNGLVTDGDGPLPDGWQLTTDRERFSEAAAVVFHVPSMSPDAPRSKPPGQIWVAWSMECEINYPELRDPGFMQWFDLRMTYRLDADVVHTYASYYVNGANLLHALRRPPRPKRTENLAALFISSGLNQSSRFDYATELMRHLDVHSYGKALRNRELIGDRGRSTKLATIANYKFTLAFENAIDEDYVTEKFFDPLVTGSVPVYLGAPNIETFAPGDRCFINVADFRHPHELAEYLLYLHQNDAEYASYFAWKDQPFRPAFSALMTEQATAPAARLCHALDARLGSL